MSNTQNVIFLYFAYGSNMLTSRLVERTPSAKFQHIGYVIGYRLEFNKPSDDGSGKAHIEATGEPTDRVYGVLFRIDGIEEHKLDQAEGNGKGYRKDTAQVVTTTGIVAAKTYIATEKDPACIPYHWYKELVVTGACEHCLPANYIERLRTTVSQPDPDPKRRHRNENLLPRCSIPSTSSRD